MQDKTHAVLEALHILQLQVAKLICQYYDVALNANETLASLMGSFR